MLLPLSKLHQVDYYEVKLIKHWPFNNRHSNKTCIVIHWKQWWKLRSRFYFPAITTTTSEDEYSVRYNIGKNANHLMLENQLFNYISS